MPSLRQAIAGTCVLALAGLTALVAVRAPGLVRADAAVSAAAGRFTAGHPAFRAAAAAVTHSADPVVLRVLLVAGLGGAVALRRWSAAVFVLAVALVGTGARLGLLHLIARPRPEHRLIESYGYSFPSGHTTSSTLAAGVAIAAGLALLRARWARRAVVAVAVWPVLVGLSRVVLLAHWPSDVLGGWLLGTAVVLSLYPLASWKDDPDGSADPAPGGRRRGPRWLRRPGPRPGAGEPGAERPGGPAAQHRGEPVTETAAA